MHSLTTSLTAFALSCVSIASAQSHLATTGASTSPVVGAIRPNITQLYQDQGPAWDLYILALAAMQEAPSDDPQSWFQLAAIHGDPVFDWNDSGPQEGDGWLGYCPHGEHIFSTWHRPYVATYEQVLQAHAVNIASVYPDSVRPDYVAAADALRSPYWDWTTGIPEAISSDSVSINMPTPDGLSVEKAVVPNPLWKYVYPEDKVGTFDGNNTGTSRPCNYPADAQAALDQSLDFSQNSYDSLSFSKTFEEFAGGLENMHNAIHNIAGCSGTFVPLQTSGFEPLFMLHHTNVDRLLAYWQFSRPELALFNGSYLGASRYGVATNTSIDIDSPLQPFFQPDGETLHTSRSVANISLFNYAYDGLEWWAFDEQTLISRANQMINHLYAPAESPYVAAPDPAVRVTSRSSTVAPEPTTSISLTEAPSAPSSDSIAASTTCTSSTLGAEPSSYSVDPLPPSPPPPTSSGDPIVDHWAPDTVIPAAPQIGRPSLDGKHSRGRHHHRESCAGREDCSPKGKKSTSRTRFFVDLSVDLGEIANRPARADITLKGQRAGQLYLMMLPLQGTNTGSYSLDKVIKNTDVLHGVDRTDAEAVLDRLHQYIEVTITDSTGSSLAVQHLKGLELLLHQDLVAEPVAHDALPYQLSRQTKVSLKGQ